MAKIGFSEIVAVSVNMNGSIGKSFSNSDITTSHVCIEDTCTAFDSNDGFTWETRSGSVYIHVISGTSSSATATLHFGIPVN